jgi:catechol 2,3-dioxygenase-like lactoylglutathione lyase family enzyme
MSITGIDRVTFGVEDMATCRRFFTDLGLGLQRDHAAGLDFTTLNGCELWLRAVDDAALPPAVEPGSSLRQVIWSAEDVTDITRARAALAGTPGAHEADDTIFGTDADGLGCGVRISRKSAVTITGAPTNSWGRAARIDAPSPVYDHAEPIEVGHVVFFTGDLAAATAFYEQLGFCLSDRYPNHGHFLRTAERGGHHDMFLLQRPDRRRGLNHVAFAVRDIHEVFGGGLHMSRQGWKTQLGPGKHPVSSAIFWYFQSPAGALAEYYADEDVLTENWAPRDLTPSPQAFAEWAVTGGIDGSTRRQAEAGVAPDGRFITDKRE